MNEQNEEIEIDLLRLFRFILSKFKTLLILGIVFAVLGFSYKYCRFEFSSTPLAEVNNLFTIEKIEKEPDGKVVKKKEKVSYNLYKEDYEARYSEYESKKRNVDLHKKFLEQDFENFNRELETTQEYIRNSKLYNLSPESYWESEFYYSVREKNAKTAMPNIASVKKALKSKEEGEEETFENESTVVRFANRLLHTQKYIQAFAKSLGISMNLTQKPVRELFGFSAIDSYSFVISLKGDSKETLSKLEKVKEVFDKEFTDFYGQDYIIKIVPISLERIYNAGLIKLKRDTDNAVVKLNNEIENKKNQILNQVQPLPPEDIDVKMKTLESYKFMKLVIFTVAGLFFGVFIGAAYFGMKYLFSGKLTSAEYLKNVYSIKNIAVLHESSFSKEVANSKLLLENAIEIISKGKKKVVLVSTLDGKEIANATEAISNTLSKLSVSFDLVKDCELKEITYSDAVIVIEKLDVSLLDATRNEIELLQSYKAPLEGIVYA
ncbi:MAG: hypothetical protein ACI4NC_06635 [Succinivibrio sp.]